MSPSLSSEDISSEEEDAEATDRDVESEIREVEAIFSEDIDEPRSKRQKVDQIEVEEPRKLGRREFVDKYWTTARWFIDPLGTEVLDRLKKGGYQLAHIIPRCKGGRSVPWNLIPTSVDTNFRMGTSDPWNAFDWCFAHQHHLFPARARDIRAIYNRAMNEKAPTTWVDFFVLVFGAGNPEFDGGITDMRILQWAREQDRLNNEEALLLGKRETTLTETERRLQHVRAAFEDAYQREMARIASDIEANQRAMDALTGIKLTLAERMQPVLPAQLG